jgi:hypothetical protein
MNAGIPWGLSQMGSCRIFFNVSVLVCVGEILLPPLEMFYCCGHKTLGRRAGRRLLQSLTNSFLDRRSAIILLKEDIGEELSNSRSSPHRSYSKWRKPWLCFRNRSDCINILYRVGPKNLSAFSDMAVLSRLQSGFGRVYYLIWGHALAYFVKALCYKHEGRGFYSRWGHWISSFNLKVLSRPSIGVGIGRKHRSICGFKYANLRDDSARII